MQFGEIHLCRFPFTTGGEFKIRPALVLFDLAEDAMICRVTSVPRSGPLDVPVRDWQAAGLLKPSIVSLDRLVTAEKTIFLRTLGALSAEAEQTEFRMRPFAGKYWNCCDGIKIPSPRSDGHTMRNEHVINERPPRGSLPRFPAPMNRFNEKLSDHGLRLSRSRLQTLQINVGRKCNQTCRHCHVDAGPTRTEMMSAGVAHRVGAWIREHRPAIVDITGGAPELSEHFRYFVETARSVGSHVIDRNNLTIIETAAFAWLPEYLAEHEVEVVASLPCYSAANVDAQRGDGVFAKSISALRKLNAAGYGTRLPLSLVYNPLGAALPGPQPELEADYQEALKRDFGIVFTRLFTITNQPIARFAEDLRAQGQWDSYHELLANSFNPDTVENLMCRSTVSIGWMGEVFDCDFNQMLGMQLRNGKPLFLWEVTPDSLDGRHILTGNHCLACTAGCGSSCTGETIDVMQAISAAG